MWFKEYRDYPIDKPLIQEQVKPGHGIIGCEMHDLNGWGTDLHQLRLLHDYSKNSTDMGSTFGHDPEVDE